MIGVGILQLAILFVALARAKGLAIVLGPEGLGIVGTIDQLVITLAQMGSLGIPYTAMKFMSAAHSRSREAYLEEFAVFGRTMLAMALVAVGVGVSVLLFAPDVLDSVTAQYRDAVFVAIFAVPTMMMAFFLPQALAAAQRPNSAALFNLAVQGSLAIAALTGAVLSGIYGLYIATALAGTAFIVLSLVVLARFQGLSVFRKRTARAPGAARDPLVLRTAFMAYSSLVAYALCLLVIRYAVLRSVGEAATGFLQAALAVALSIGSILATMNNLYLAPALNRALPAVEKFIQARNFASLIALLLLAAAVPVALFPGLTLTILYTSQFTPAATALILCVLWQGLHQFAGVYLQVLIGQDHLRFATFSTILGLVISSVLVFVLVGRFGIIAAPLALIAGSLVSAVLNVARLAAVEKMPVPWDVAARYLLAAVAVLGAGLLFAPASELTLQGMALRAGYWAAALLVAWVLHARDPVLKMRAGARLQ